MDHAASLVSVVLFLKYNWNVMDPAWWCVYYSSFLSDFNDDCCSIVLDLKTTGVPVSARAEPHETYEGFIFDTWISFVP